MYRTLGISYQQHPSFFYGEEQLRHARAAGFTAVDFSTDGDINFSDATRLAARQGMRVSALRLAADTANRIWRAETDEGLLLSFFARTVEEAATAGIRTLILRPAVGKAPPVRQFALNRIGRIADMAKEAGVRLAFENDTVGEHFVYVVRSFCLGYHGVCFDPVAAYASLGTTALPAFCRSHVIALSLGDLSEAGRCLPFEGCLDLAPLAADLAKEPYRGTLSLHMEGDAYAHLGYDEFAARAYGAMHRFSRLCDDAEDVI